MNGYKHSCALCTYVLIAIYNYNEVCFEGESKREGTEEKQKFVEVGKNIALFLFLLRFLARSGEEFRHDSHVYEATPAYQPCKVQQWQYTLRKMQRPCPIPSQWETA